MITYVEAAHRDQALSHPRPKSRSLALTCALNTWSNAGDKRPATPCVGTLFRVRNEHISNVGNLPRAIAPLRQERLPREEALSFFLFPLRSALIDLGPFLSQSFEFVLS